MSQKIQALAERFAAEILQAARSMSLADILGMTSTPTRTPKRTNGVTPKKTNGGIDAKLVAAVKAHGASGVSGEVLRKDLKWGKPMFQYRVKAAIKARAIKKTGIKRATRYFPA